MSAPTSAVPPTVTVVCPTCQTPLQGAVRAERHAIQCPDCQRHVPVPSRDELARAIQQKKRESRTEDVAAYRLQTDRPTGRSPALPESVTIICPVCRARLDPDVKGLAYLYRCPDCHESVRVPSRRAVDAKRRRKKVPVIPPVEGYSAATPPERPPLETKYLEAQADIRREPVDPPPKWTFFSGVFDFPWRAGTIVRWGYLAAGVTSLGLLVTFIVSLATSISGGYGGLGLAFFVLPAIWIGIWTFSYAAACCMAILLDTAAGIDRIAHWPEPIWKEWAEQLFYVGFIAAQAVTVGYGLGKLAEWTFGGFWPVCVGTAWILYPIFLLSSLEAGSPFVPLSAPLVQSLASCWREWLLYYLLSGLLLAGWIALLLSGAARSPYLTMLLCGPLLAALLFISARLLGRLAWRALLEASRTVPARRVGSGG